MAACGWTVLGCASCDAYASLDPDIQTEVQLWAVNRLWEWTNQRYGPCELTVHNESDGCCWLRENVYPLCRTNEVRLPAPISEIIEVTVGGEEVDLAALHVDNYSLLVRDDGGTFNSNWEVTYLHGEPVPPGGGLIAGILACEYAKALCGTNDCRLPRRVSSIQRQGVVIGMLDNFTNLEDGFTGIFEIDDWLMAATKPHRRTVVSSPDVTPPRIRTWSYVES